MCPCAPDRIGIWKCWFWKRGKNRSTEIKSPYKQREPPTNPTNIWRRRRQEFKLGPLTGGRRVLSPQHHPRFPDKLYLDHINNHNHATWGHYIIHPINNVQGSGKRVKTHLVQGHILCMVHLSQGIPLDNKICWVMELAMKSGKKGLLLWFNTTLPADFLSVSQLCSQPEVWENEPWFIFPSTWTVFPFLFMN